MESRPEVVMSSKANEVAGETSRLENRTLGSIRTHRTRADADMTSAVANAGCRHDGVVSHARDALRLSPYGGRDSKCKSNTLVV